MREKNFSDIVVLLSQVHNTEIQQLQARIEELESAASANLSPPLGEGKGKCSREVCLDPAMFEDTEDSAIVWPTNGVHKISLAMLRTEEASNAGFSPEEARGHEAHICSDELARLRGDGGHGTHICSDELARLCGEGGHEAHVCSDELARLDGDDEGEPCQKKLSAECTRSLETPLERWESVVGFVLNPDTSVFLRDPPDLAMHRVWLISAQQLAKLNHSSTSEDNGSPRASQRKFGTISMHGQYVRGDHPLQDFVMDPAGIKPLAWGAFGALLLLYDILVTPLSFFILSPRATSLISEINKATLAYWLLDVLVQVCTGIHANGVIDMRPPEILRHYIKTWFLPDSVILLIDLTLLYLTSFVGGASSLRIARMLRLLRLCRFVRIRRLKRLVSSFENLSLQISSAYILLLLSLMQHVFCILLINHYIACTWYYISWISVSNLSFDSCWLRTFEIEFAPAGRQYALAFHWSLTQFSPATNNINASNTLERAFSCVVVVFAMVIFSSFISNITSTVNQLKQLNSRKTAEETLIRKFLRERTISIELGGNIIAFFNTHFHRSSALVHESDIKIMAELPERLILKLHDEMYRPMFCASALLGKFLTRDSGLVSKLCHETTSMWHYMASQDVFAEEVECGTAYYMSRGVATYLASRYRPSSIFQPPKMAPDAIEAGVWLCEMAFWIPWYHKGRLNCSSNSELIRVHCAKFAGCVSSRGGETYHSLCVLAIYLVGYIEKCLDDATMDLSDLPMEEDETEEITSRAFAFCTTFQANRVRDKMRQSCFDASLTKSMTK